MKRASWRHTLVHRPCHGVRSCKERRSATKCVRGGAVFSDRGAATKPTGARTFGRVTDSRASRWNSARAAARSPRAAAVRKKVQSGLPNRQGAPHQPRDVPAHGITKHDETKAHEVCVFCGIEM